MIRPSMTYPCSANTFSHEKLTVPFREYVSLHMAPQDIEKPGTLIWDEMCVEPQQAVAMMCVRAGGRARARVRACACMHAFSKSECVRECVRVRACVRASARKRLLTYSTHS